jgi:hypothetical protein
LDRYQPLDNSCQISAQFHVSSYWASS